MQAIEQKIREETSAMLLSRARVVAGVVILCILVGEASTFLLESYTQHGHRRAVSAGGLLLMVGLLYATLHPSRFAPPRLVALGGIIGLHSYMFALTLGAGPHAETVAVLSHCLIALGAAVLLPWGVWVQVVVAVVAFGVLHANLAVLPGQIIITDTSLGVAVANGLWLSVFIAYAMERSRRSLSRKRHELAEQKEVAERQRIKAEALAQDLDAYAQAVAHDLRNPVHVIAGFSDLLGAEKDKLSDDGQMFLDSIVSGCEKMAQIINELLLLATVRKNVDVPIKALDMSAIVAEALQRQASDIAQSDAEVVLPDDWPTAAGYASWIEEVWANYISNAIKYGGTPPLLEIGAERENGAVYYWLRDNGPGLTSEQIGKLFREFSRASPATGRGYGLGLSIVKRIVEQLGGEVRVTSTVGRGSTFGFTLPAASQPAGNRASRDGQSAAADHLGHGLRQQLTAETPLNP